MRNRTDYNWLEMLAGIIFILIGIYTFKNPGLTLTGFVVAYGILAVISGIADIAFYAHLERHIGFGPTASLVLGILNTLIGFFLISNSDFGVLAAGVIFPIWFIAHCLSKLLNADFVRIYFGHFQYWLTLIINILGVLLGFLLLMNPFASAVSMVYIAGTYLILLGIESIILAVGKEL